MHIIKLLAQMAGTIIMTGLIILVLWGLVKLSIFLITIGVIVIGFALAVIIAVGLIVVLFQVIRETFCKKGKDKNSE